MILLALVFYSCTLENILKGVKRNPISGEKKDGIKTLRSQLRNARGGDAMSRIHIADAIKRVNNILDPK